MGKSLEAAFMSAKRCVKRKEFERAQQLYEAVLLEFPGNVRARQGLDTLRKVKGETVALDGAPPPEQTNRFLALFNAGRVDEALAMGQALLADYPRSVLLHDLIGQIHYGRRQLVLAVASFRRAVAVRPDCAETQYNLGLALQGLGDEEGALESYEAAIAAKPDYFAAHNNLGALYVGMGRPRDAIAALQNVLKLKADYVDAYVNLGNAYREIGYHSSASSHYQQALALEPHNAKAHYNFGLFLSTQGKKGEAIMELERAILHDPTTTAPHREMAKLMLEFELREDAIACSDRALAIDPDDTISRSAKLHQLGYICDWDRIEQDRHLIPALGTGEGVSDPWAMLSLEDAPERHRLRSERSSAARTRKTERHVFTPPQDAKSRPLRIGYFTSDIHNHATMHLFGGALELHDRSRFEIHAFSYGDEDSGPYRHLFDRFHDVRKINDEEAAALARKAEIDVAVDLKGYTKGGRLGIFAHGAAPVQMSYLGYPGTSGAPFVDYMIADEIVVPQEQRAHYSESVIYLPGSYQANDNRREIADLPLTRTQMGLPENAFVFACFNNSFKISPDAFDIWMRLLGKVEGSVLWLYKANHWAEANLRREAEKRGVDPCRLVFAENMVVDQHLARQRLADLFLDTFHYNAHTTASDALWGGLPVLTRMGKSFSARVAGSLLHAIGLPELAVETSEEYEALALELATNPAKLGELRARLVANRLTHPLFDTESFVRHIEAGYDAAYDLFLKGRAPQDIHVGGA